MSVFWQINLQHQDADALNIDRCAFNIIRDYLACHDCRPRKILLAANGIGAVVGEILASEGIPVEVVSPAHWRQVIDPIFDGPTEAHEICL
jgi:hypothetical protein